MDIAKAAVVLTPEAARFPPGDPVVSIRTTVVLRVSTAHEGVGVGVAEVEGVGEGDTVGDGDGEGV